MNNTTQLGWQRVLTAACVLGVACAQAQGRIEVETSQRLSGWLNQNADLLRGTEPLGLGWSTPEERARQAAQRQADVAWLRQGLLRPDASAVWRWLDSSPVTGRLVLSSATAPWLEGVPGRDPLLREGDSLWSVPAGLPVSLLGGNGQGCRMPHRAGAWVADYVAACGITTPSRVWVVQPDGRVRAVNLQAWLPEPQTQLAPGALVWLGWPRELLRTDVLDEELDRINHNTARWLSTAHSGDLPDVEIKEPVQSLSVTLPVPVAETDWMGLKGARFSPVPSTSNWGVVGLMQTPTARMRSAGSLSVSWMNTRPHTWVNVMLQPLDWLEGGFRYVSVANRLYGPADFSGSQAYKDKSFEVKARVIREGDWWPELAVGIRDLGGTGFFGGEYLVASKRWGRVDASLGLGWGYVGARGSWSNPLRVLDRSFETRQNEVGMGGTLSTGAYFRGRTAPFGGLEYQSGWGPVFKVEYNGNNYRNEPQDNNQRVRSPVNFGLVYRWFPGVDIHASWERGNTLGVGVSFWTDLARLNMPKLTDKPLPPVMLTPPSSPPDWRRTMAEVETQTNWQVRQLLQDGSTLGVEVMHSQDTYIKPRLDRVMRLVQRDAPADIKQVEVRHWAAGDVVAIDRMDRERWLQTLSEPARTSQPEPLSKREWPAAHSQTQKGELLQAREDMPYLLVPGTGLRHSLGGPDAFILYKLSLTLNGELQLPLDWKLYGLAELRTLSNYNKFKFKGWGTDLPRVRTYVREYETRSYLTLPRLYLARSVRLSDSVMGSMYGGLLESMYGGVGGELLYRPRGSTLAVGLDANRVQQRDFDQKFSMRDYKVSTGHLTAYWETPWQGLVATLSVGQYLAGDRGATLKLTRTFSNGSTIGAFATRTNVSAEQFGEGSFNKGLFWSIPFDAFMPSSSRMRASFNWVPLTRDGGAMLERPHQLSSDTVHLSPNAYTYEPAPSRQRIPDDLP